MKLYSTKIRNAAVIVGVVLAAVVACKKKKKDDDQKPTAPKVEVKKPEINTATLDCVKTPNDPKCPKPPVPVKKPAVTDAQYVDAYWMSFYNTLSSDEQGAKIAEILLSRASEVYKKALPTSVPGAQGVAGTQGSSASVQGASASIQGTSPATQGSSAAVQGTSPVVQGTGVSSIEVAPAPREITKVDSAMNSIKAQLDLNDAQLAATRQVAEIVFDSSNIIRSGYMMDILFNFYYWYNMSLQGQVIPAIQGTGIAGTQGSGVPGTQGSAAPGAQGSATPSNQSNITIPQAE